MDYKDLIDELRMVASWNISDCYDCNQCLKAAAAIETLMAELREYRENGLTQTNNPLTLDELLEMNGEPVWVICKLDGATKSLGWALVEVELEDVASTNFRLDFDTYGEDVWLAYRWKWSGQNCNRIKSPFMR